MDIRNYLDEKGNAGIASGGQINGAFVSSMATTLQEISVDNDRAKNELVLTYPIAYGNAILLVARTDGNVSGMQLLAAGTTSTVIDTSRLSNGPHLLMIQNSTCRRIIEFVK